MYDYDLFVRALVVALKLSEAGKNIDDLGYYPVLNLITVYFSNGKRAAIKVNGNGILPGLELMQVVLEVIRIETEAGKNEN